MKCRTLLRWTCHQRSGGAGGISYAKPPTYNPRVKSLQKDNDFLCIATLLFCWFESAQDRITRHERAATRGEGILEKLGHDIGLSDDIFANHERGYLCT